MAPFMVQVLAAQSAVTAMGSTLVPTKDIWSSWSVMQNPESLRVPRAEVSVCPAAIWATPFASRATAPAAAAPTVRTSVISVPAQKLAKLNGARSS